MLKNVRKGQVLSIPLPDIFQHQVHKLQVGLELDLRLEVLEQHQELEKGVPAGHNAGLYCHEHKDFDGND